MFMGMLSDGKWLKKSRDAYEALITDLYSPENVVVMVSAIMCGKPCYFSRGCRRMNHYIVRCVMNYNNSNKNNNQSINQSINQSGFISDRKRP